jgi:hypothetical protein
MTDDLVKRLSGIADVLTVLFPEFSKDINAAADRIEQLEAALRKLDDMIYELDAGNLDLYEVGDFIDAALGEKKDG